MLIPLIASQEAAAVVTEPGPGGGGGRRKRVPVRPWRDPMYLTAELQAELTEDQLPSGEADESEVAAEIVAEAASFIGGVYRPVGGLAKLPAPPHAVVHEILELSVVRDWGVVIEAIKEAHRRTRDRKERQEIMRYRVQVEALRRAIAKRRDEDDSVSLLMAEGWL